MNITILSERRVYPPFGLLGGEHGSRGLNLLIRSNGTKINLLSKNNIDVKPGDRIVIYTPGGGGYGK